MTKNIFLLVCVFSSLMLRAQHVAVFCGGEMYQNIEANAGTLKLSGFNTIIFWSVHVGADGTLILNDSKIIEDGEYVGHESWLREIAILKEQPSSVDRIEFSVGAWSVPDFENIESLIDSEGIGESSILYRNFKKLKEISGADAIDYDDESNYDVGSTVAFSEMLVNLGYKITLCPYTKSSFWKSVYDQVRAEYPDAIDRIYLQCYAGGAANTPAAWNDLFEGLQVTPGLWCSHGADCMSGLDWRGVQHKLSSWRSGIEGGFMWSFDGILGCSMGGTPEDYAGAIRDVMGMETVVPGKAYQPSPSDFSTEVSVDENLKWVAGSFDAKHKVYLGADSLLTESDYLGTTRQAEFEPGTLKNDMTYYWRVDEYNDAGTAMGDVWQFTAEVITMPAGKAGMPQPVYNAEDVDIRTSLSWTSGEGYVKHKVYFGVNNPLPFVSEQTDTVFSPEILESETTYYWRIDETNSSGVTEGDVWSFTTRGGPVAHEAEVSVSSEYPDPNYWKSKVTDGIVGMNGQGEWASNGEITPWVKLSWSEEKTIVRIVLYDRPNSVDLIEEGELTFSDGSSMDVGALPNDGEALEIGFPEKTVSWVKFQVNKGGGLNVGLSEFEVFETLYPVGISRIHHQGFSVYPNPASNGQFFLDIPSEDLFRLQVYDAGGQLMKSQGNCKDRTLVDIKDLPHGLYALKISNATGVFVSQVLH